MREWETYIRRHRQRKLLHQVHRRPSITTAGSLAGRLLHHLVEQIVHGLLDQRFERVDVLLSEGELDHAAVLCVLRGVHVHKSRTLLGC